MTLKEQNKELKEFIKDNFYITSCGGVLRYRWVEDTEHEPTELLKEIVEEI
jgi:hypothetical protein